MARKFCVKQTKQDKYCMIFIEEEHRFELVWVWSQNKGIVRSEEESLREVGSRHGNEIIPMTKGGGEATRGRWRRRRQERPVGPKLMIANYNDSL